MNLSPLTRKEQVLEYLRAHRGEWVNGMEFRTPEVGGSAGDSRVRDLRKDGFVIAVRSHPDRKVDQYQYQITFDPERDVVVQLTLDGAL